MNFTEKEVKRAIRTFDMAATDIVNAGYNTYKARIKRFVEIMENNNVINSIISPLLTIELNFEEIHHSHNGYWISELRLPTDINQQLAYVLKIFVSVSQGELHLDDLTSKIYKRKSFEDNIQSWIYEVASPCLRELSYRLQDLVEDEVEGKEEVQSSALQIVNYGTITAEQGSAVAIGKDIQQTVTYKNIVNEIIEKVKAENIVPEAKLPEVEKVTKEIEEEINNANPSPTKLKQFANKLYEIGQTGLLKAASTIIADPRWGQAVADTLMTVM
jgi:hypothetical protein